MKGRVAAVWLSWVMIFGCIVIIIDVAEPIRGATTIYVDDSGGADHRTIQRAIDEANHGDTIFVFSGTYIENIYIDKTINLTGENKETTIIDGGGNYDVVKTGKDWINITGFTITNSGNSSDYSGIKLFGEKNCRIYDNIIESNNRNGIYLHQYSDNNLISNNEIFSNGKGIHIYSSSMNTISNNNIFENNEAGIRIYSSQGNIITGNTLMDSSIILGGYSLEDWNTHIIDTSNFVNGKPVHYWKNRTGGAIPSNAGQIILANCKNVRIENQKVNDVSVGIALGFSSNNFIEDNEISTIAKYGIYLLFSNENEIMNNDIFDNLGSGVYLTRSKENEINKNVINNNNREGIVIDYYSDNNLISDNQVDLNLLEGIKIYFSNDNQLKDNLLTDNFIGISLSQSKGINLSGNEMIKNGIEITGDEIEEWMTHEIGISNIVNDKPVFFFKNQKDIKFREEAGQVILANCENMKIEYMNISLTSTAISLGFSSNNFLISNQLSSNKYFGIKLEYSDNNYISNNIIEDNDYGGISLYDSDYNDLLNNRIKHNKNGIYLSSCTENDIINNIISNNNYGVYSPWAVNNNIYHNNFISNSVQVYIDPPNYPGGGGLFIFQSNNKWDDGYPSGGNFWSDFQGFDENRSEDQDEIGSDGIGDVPYKIYRDNDDNYPLMDPVEINVDTTPPSVYTSSIKNQTTNVSPEEKLVIEFNEPMDTKTVESATSISPEIEYSCEWENDNKTMTINFTEPLAYDMTYKVNIDTRAKNEAGLRLENEMELEFTTQVRPIGKEYDFPILYLLIIAIIVLIIIISYALAKRRKPSVEIITQQHDSGEILQVTCPYCSNNLQVNDIGTTMNVSCPYCSQVLTVESRNSIPQFYSAAHQQPAIKISCPNCRFSFDVKKSSAPIQVQCPNCKTTGTLG
jgi:parallel beta-helix repeat protein